MGVRGRNAEVLSGHFGERPEPPDILTEKQAAVWRAVVATEVVDFFHSAALKNLLADYCRHTVTSEEISAELGAIDPGWSEDDVQLRRINSLTQMRERETKAAVDRASKLRLTNLSRYTPGAAATATKHNVLGKRLWDAA